MPVGVPADAGAPVFPGAASEAMSSGNAARLEPEALTGSSSALAQSGTFRAAHSRSTRATPMPMTALSGAVPDKARLFVTGRKP